MAGMFLRLGRWPRWDLYLSSTGSRENRCFRWRSAQFPRAMTLVVPGTLGGGNWSGASFDRASGYLFVNANELGAVGAMEPQAADAPEQYRRGSKEGEYARFWDQNQWPCQKPPWGTLNAVDVNKGEIAWKVPL